MKLVKSIIIAAFLTLEMGNSVAGGTAPAATVKNIFYYEGHVGMLIIPDASVVNPDLCERKDYYILRNTHPLYKEMTAVVLAAHLSGLPLVISVSGCVQGLPSVVNILTIK